MDFDKSQINKKLLDYKYPLILFCKKRHDLNAKMDQKITPK